MALELSIVTHISRLNLYFNPTGVAWSIFYQINSLRSSQEVTELSCSQANTFAPISVTLEVPEAHCVVYRPSCEHLLWLKPLHPSSPDLWLFQATGLHPQGSSTGDSVLKRSVIT